MPIRILVLVGLLLSFGLEASAQSVIPRDIRGDEDMIARGILDGNLIQTNFRNHGEASRWNDLPWGIWPRGIGDRHLDGIGVMVAGRVVGERAKWPFYAGKPDTLVNPVILTYREAGTTTGPSGERWGWLPLPGFHNTARRNALGDLEPVPALSDDASSWPVDWPDRRGNPDDPGWPGSWNGFFGKGVFNADLESYYVIDDHSDMEYSVDPDTDRPLSNFGVFYPSPSDSTMGGLGLQTAVRIFQWANVLAEDVMFLLYRITNVGETLYAPNPSLPEDSPDEVGLWFSQLMDYGLGWEEGDELSRFDAQLDVVFGWDIDGVGTNATGGQYDLGYTGFAFLESPARDDDGRDDDGDGIIDELRFGGPGVLIEGQDDIRAFVEANYDLVAFEAFNGPLEERDAYEAGYWWTGDENLDWRTFDDQNEDGMWDPNTEFV
ncbi:MAG: hypothetical protein HKO76_09585, partial [Acidimicrobiia bacterium]|nr:hypothetical protein [Acidimicrobiia bacterium]